MYLEDLQTGVTDPAAGDDQLDLDALEDDQQVPVSVLKAIREELKASKAEGATLKEQMTQLSDALTLYRMQVQQQGAQPGGAPQPQQQYRGPQSLAGLDDDEIPTVGQIKALVQEVQTAMAIGQNIQQLVGQPDFQDVITKHWPQVRSNLPNHVLSIFAALPEAAQAQIAYALGKTAPSYQGAAAGHVMSAEAKRVAENLLKPGSPSGRSSPAPASTADLIASMTSEEFRAYRDKIRRGVTS